MNEQETICQEIYDERVGICIESGLAEQQAEAAASIEVQKYKEANGQ